ncbi:non-ribosomal peptide synthetase [Kitasatospora purpeofusca]|uniref:non-ribosomal peptide synthetase n=1 Tax=Kitasatospora purpeofusca TaxID=67352 RepID=UPI0032481699
MVTQRGLAGYLRWCLDAYPGLSGRALLHSAVSFDLTVTTLFGPLSAGGAVVVADPYGAEALPAGDRVAFLKVTPSHLALLEALSPAAPPTTDLVVGGEQLLGEQLDAWRRQAPGATVTNEYGPTEATVGCITYRIGPGDELPPGPVPIGRPAPGVRAHVLDERLRPVAEGVTGELFVAGDQPANGYLNRPDLTEERFVPDPFGAAGARMYRTGDLVHRRPDGNLVFVGRADQQVKIRSHRVEPGEPEAVLLADPRVAQACVVPAPSRTGPRLVAYVVPGPGTVANGEDLAAGLRARTTDRLPSYMVPSHVVLLDGMPLTTQGKIDRVALAAAVPPDTPAPTAAGKAPTSGEPQAAATEAERLLAGLRAELLAVEHVGPNENFFTLGGNSLLGIQLSARARRIGLALTPTDVFRAGTVRAMAARTEAGTPAPHTADQG